MEQIKQLLIKNYVNKTTKYPQILDQSLKLYTQPNSSKLIIITFGYNEFITGVLSMAWHLARNLLLSLAAISFVGISSL
jgi:hypothetical protein